MAGVLLRDRRDVGIRLDVEVEEAFPLLSDADVWCSYEGASIPATPLVRPLHTLGTLLLIYNRIKSEETSRPAIS